MKKLLIIYNVIFFLVGNILFSNIHYLHDHHHSHHDYLTDDCQECILIENNNNYVVNSCDLSFSNNAIYWFVALNYNFFEVDLKQTYSSRAPPIS